MATIGRSVPTQAWNVFEGLRTFDAARACQDLSEDAVFVSPWSGRLEGKAAVAAWLETFLGDVEARPSLTVMDVGGDGNLTRFRLSASGRFGRGAKVFAMDVLYLRGRVHQVALAAA